MIERDSAELMEISEAELEAAIADTASGMPEAEREALLNLIEKGLVVESGMRRNGQWQCVSPRPWGNVRYIGIALIRMTKDISDRRGLPLSLITAPVKVNALAQPYADRLAETF